MSHADSLAEAIRALDLLAVGEIPHRKQALAGASALDSIAFRARWTADQERDLVDLARHLQILASGGYLELDVNFQGRAAALARIMRELAEHAS